MLKLLEKESQLGEEGVGQEGVKRGYRNGQVLAKICDTGNRLVVCMFAWAAQ